MTSLQYDNLTAIYEKAPNKSSFLNITDQGNQSKPDVIKKLQNFRLNYSFSKNDEECLFLYHNTVFADNTEGFLITDKYIYFKEVTNDGNFVEISELTSFEKIQDNRIRFNNYEQIILFELEKNTDIFIEIVKALISYNKLTTK